MDSLSQGRGCRGQKIRVGKQVCIHHRHNVAVWRGLGGSAGFVSVRWGSRVGEEAAPGWAGGQGWHSPEAASVLGESQMLGSRKLQVAEHS